MAEAAIEQDLSCIEALLQGARPKVDWIRLDDVGLGHDWSGIRLALIFAAEHPHLQTTVGLVIGADGANLTLGRIDAANIDAFRHSIEQSVNQPGRFHQSSKHFPPPDATKQSPRLSTVEQAS